MPSTEAFELVMCCCRTQTGSLIKACRLLSYIMQANEPTRSTITQSNMHDS